MKQQLYDLPDGWEWKDILKVAQIGTDKGYMPQPDEGGKIPFISMSDIDQDTGLKSIYQLKDFEEVKRGYTKFQKNAVLLAKITPCTENNKTTLITEIEGGFATTEVHAIHPLDIIEPKYLLYFFRSPEIRDLLIHKMEGATGRQRVPLKIVQSISIPICSPAKQQNIVKKLDILLPKIDTAIDYLQRNIALADELFASALNEQINKAVIVDTKLFDKLSKFIDYRGKTPKKTESGIPLITAKNIRIGFINDEPKEFISESSYDDWMTRGLPNKGDILFTTEAPLGNVALVDRVDKFALAQRVICLQALNIDEYYSPYLAYYMQSDNFKDMLDKGKTGTTVKGIKSSVMKKFKIPLPILEDQKKIASYLDEQQIKISGFIQTTQATILFFEELKNSILDAAFKGKL